MNLVEFGMRGTGMHFELGSISSIWNRLAGEGTVALKASDADPAPSGATTERQSRGTHVFTMHANTGFSAHLMFWVGWRGLMQQCLQESRQRQKKGG
jgi:hypothetical protein